MALHTMRRLVLLVAATSLPTTARAEWKNLTVFHTNQANYSAGDIADMNTADDLVRLRTPRPAQCWADFGHRSLTLVLRPTTLPTRADDLPTAAHTHTGRSGVYGTGEATPAGVQRPRVRTPRVVRLR